METNALPESDDVHLPAGHYLLAAEQLPDLVITDSLTIVGAGGEATVVDAAGGPTTVFRIAEDARVTLERLKITGGNGGVSNLGSLTLSDCVVSGNHRRGVGGGIYNFGTAILVRTAVSDNRSSPYADPWGYSVEYPRGGGIHTHGDLTVIDSSITGNSAYHSVGRGGGIFVGPRSNTLLVNSLVSANLAGMGGYYDAASGGGIFVEGSARLVNSTVSTNRASGWCYQGFPCGDLGRGGGIFVQAPGSVMMSHVTLAENIAFRGAAVGGGGDASMAHSIVGRNYNGLGTYPDLTCTDYTPSPGPLNIGPSLCFDFDPSTIGADPVLGPLHDHGGPTPTHALLLAVSPGIDAIPPEDCTWDDDGEPGTPELPVATDQRGVVRPQGAGCDIGAYEALPEPGRAVLPLVAMMALVGLRRWRAVLGRDR